MVTRTGKKDKQYSVTFDMKSSHEIRVRAKTKADAKGKAFEKFKRIRNKRSEYNIDVDDHPFP